MFYLFLKLAVKMLPAVVGAKFGFYVAYGREAGTSIYARILWGVQSGICAYVATQVVLQVVTRFVPLTKLKLIQLRKSGKSKLVDLLFLYLLKIHEAHASKIDPSPTFYIITLT